MSDQDAVRCFRYCRNKYYLCYQEGCGWFVKVRRSASSRFVTEIGICGRNVPLTACLRQSQVNCEQCSAIRCVNKVQQKSVTIPGGRVEWPVITMCCSARTLAINLNTTYRLLNARNFEWKELLVEFSKKSLQITSGVRMSVCPSVYSHGRAAFTQHVLLHNF